MIRALEIVMVNLGFTSEFAKQLRSAASQIIIFYEVLAKIVNLVKKMIYGRKWKNS